MKKILLVLLSNLLLSITSDGQYSVLLNFNGANNPQGAEPRGGLILSGSKLYGMTSLGGSLNNAGNIFSVDTNGNGYKNLFAFDGMNGNQPWGKLILSGSKLFGMTTMGGYWQDGNIFSIDTNGNNFKNLYTFNNDVSLDPTEGGELILIGGVLYGTSDAGGTKGLGNVFSIDTDGTKYRDLFDFDIPNGVSPLGGLILIDKKFYGTTSGGGAHKCGVVFSIDTNGSNYKTLLNFDTINGSEPGGNLTFSGNKLYGTADLGGGYNNGCIFSIDTNGNQYKDLLDFNSINGAHPARTSLTLVGGILYGTTSVGGINGDGVIFSIDTSGNGFTDIFSNFDSTNGEAPGGVIYSGDALYGMAALGGTGSEGVVYRFKEDGLGVNAFASSIENMKVYPNPSNGIFNLVITGETKQSISIIEIYNVLGKKVYSTPLNLSHVGDFKINLSGQPNGIYLCRILSTNGELAGEGKVIIEK